MKKTRRVISVYKTRVPKKHVMLMGDRARLWQPRINLIGLENIQLKKMNIIEEKEG